MKQIFTNADKVHAAKALSRLGLEDCFEGIICFETLNPTHKTTVSDDEDDIEFVGLSSTNSTTTSSSQIFDIIGHFAQTNPTSKLPKTPIVCKPSEAAIELALKIANINPQRTVRNSYSLFLLLYYLLPCIVTYFYLWLIGKIFFGSIDQLFFEDSVRNIQAGKRVGLQTVLVSYWKFFCKQGLTNNINY